MRSTSPRIRWWIAVGLASLVIMLIFEADESGARYRLYAPEVPRTSRVYGSGIAADELANTQIGGTSCDCPSLRSSFRFRSGRSAALESIRIYLITDKEGYSGGTGGTIEVTVQPDDGTLDHQPSGTVLASTTVPLVPFPEISFSRPAMLEAGTLYHVVFQNIDQRPTENFVSVNSLFVAAAGTPRQPQLSDTDWAQLLNYGDRWELRPDYTPIMQLTYADGGVEGVGYVESWIAAAKVISGDTRVREQFVVTGGDVYVRSISVRLGRLSGIDPLLIRLEDSVGGTITEGSVASSEVPRTAVGSAEHASWATFDLPTPVILRNHNGFHLIMSTSENASYVIHGIRKGTRLGFVAPTFFGDGFAQLDAGAGWVALDPGWRGPLEEADLQFYLE